MIEFSLVRAFAVSVLVNSCLSSCYGEVHGWRIQAEQKDEAVTSSTEFYGVEMNVLRPI